MERAGLIRCFLASIDGRPKSCIQLLKNFHTMQNDDDGIVEEESGSGYSTVIEESLDRQILNLIISKGNAGITNHDLYRQMRLNPHLHYHR